MDTLTIRDPYGNTFDIDASARPFWERRDGYTILDDPAPGEEPKPAAPPAAAPTDPEAAKPGKASRSPKPLAAE